MKADGKGRVNRWENDTGVTPMMFVQYHPLLYVLTRKIHLRCLVSEHGSGAILSSVRLDIHAKEMECSAVSESHYERVDSYLNNTVL